MRADRSSSFFWIHQVVPPPRYQVAPAVFLCVMKRESVPRQTHQLGSDSHLQADEAGSRRPAVLLRHLLTKLPIPAKAGRAGFKRRGASSVITGSRDVNSGETVWEQFYPGCPGRCCLLFGSRLTVSCNFSTANLLGHGPASSSSEAGPGSGEVVSILGLTQRNVVVFFKLTVMATHLPLFLEEE